MKLSKKHLEIVELANKMEKETNSKIYFMFNRNSGKIHGVSITLKDNKEIDLVKNNGILCTLSVAETMKKKGIIKEEIIGKYKMYRNEEELYDYILCTLSQEFRKENSFNA
jgi:acid phosphatase class B